MHLYIYPLIETRMDRTYPLIWWAILWLNVPAWAQTGPFGNEWINHQQTYLKIPVIQPGIYRITVSELQKAGLPTATLDPSTLQLFHRGIEQAIYVPGESDNRLDPADFIEFYGQGNDGAPDSTGYSPPAAQPHAYYSLYSDTTAYFLTWRLDGKPGKRMASYLDTNQTSLMPEPYHWASELRVFTDTYAAGAVYPRGAGPNEGSILSGYDTGEGWTGPLIKAGSRHDQPFSLTNFLATAGTSPTVTWLVVGRNANDHQVRFSAGSSVSSQRPLGQASFQSYEPARFGSTLTAADISEASTLVVSLTPSQPNEEVALSYLELRYPQRTDLGGSRNKLVQLRSNPSGRSYLDLSNVPAETRLFDITDPNHVERVDGKRPVNRWQGVIHHTQTARTLLATSQPRSVSALKPVRFRPIDPDRHNYLIITHPLLQQPTGDVSDPVQAYAAYRASEAGGQYDTLTVPIDQLFDQFSYGERHPLAIRRFADLMGRNKREGPVFLFLIGQSRDPQGVRNIPDGPLLDLIPNAGWPGSDLGLVAGLHGEPANVPALPIGRLNARHPQQVLDYLRKVKQQEDTTEPALWRKNILHLSGGRSAFELRLFRDYTNDFGAVAEKSYAGARVTTLSKQTDNAVETLPVAPLINEGFGLITLFGHSSLDVADIDIGFVSNDRLGYRNKGRYPCMLVNGCAAGNFFFGRPTFGSDWILTPERGAIAFIAHTHNGLPSTLKAYTDTFYALLTDSNFVAQPIAVLQRETIRRFLKTNSSVYAITTAQQMTLQGDPAVRIFPFANPDFAFEPNTLALHDAKGNAFTTASDTIQVSAVVINYGRVSNKPLPIRIRHYAADGRLVQEKRIVQPAPAYADTLYWTLPHDRTTAGETYIDVTLDPDNQLTEGNETNNQAGISTDGKQTGPPVPTDQTPPFIEVAFDGRRIGDGDIIAPQPVIDVWLHDENLRLPLTDTTGLDLYLQRPCLPEPCPYERISLQENSARWIPAGVNNTFQLRYQPPAPLPDGRYTFLALGRDLSGNQAAPYQIRVRVRTTPELIDAGVYPNPFTGQTRFFVTLTGQTPPTDLSIRITDPTGQLVRSLHSPARIGLNEWSWDGTTDTGVRLPTGIYTYTILGIDRPLADNVLLTGHILFSR